MGCFKPLTAFQRIADRQIIFKEGRDTREIKLPCGQCIGCRLEKSRQWALRCVHEAQLHSQNCFVTLTYSDENLPQWGSLNREDLTKFFKRVRKNVGPFRYYACGEYGDETKRAHYHACLFGLDFNDKVPFSNKGGHTLYISPTLNELWKLGNTSIGELTFETAAYTARYVMKKGFGKGMPPYCRLDAETGEAIPLEQPYAVMSLRCRGADGKVGGLGSEWIRKYATDIYNHEKDFIMVRGKKMKPARYYDKVYDEINPEHMEVIKANRQLNSTTPSNATLRAREKIAHARKTYKTSI